MGVINTEICGRCGEVCPAGWCGRCHAPTRSEQEIPRDRLKALREALLLFADEMNNVQQSTFAVASIRQAVAREDVLRSAAGVVSEVARLRGELQRWHECCASVSEQTPEGWAQFTGEQANELTRLRGELQQAQLRIRELEALASPTLGETAGKTRKGTRRQRPDFYAEDDSGSSRDTEGR